MKVFGLGLKGEQAAKRYLIKKGYRILKTNFQCRFGELDLIARDGDCLVFCEVKTRSAGMIALPQEHVNVWSRYVFKGCGFCGISMGRTSFMR